MSTTQFSGSLIWIEHARHPLTTLITLITHIFREPESPNAGSASSGLSSLTSLSSHISTTETKTGRGSKRKLERCQCPQKAKNDRILSNFTKIENLEEVCYRPKASWEFRLLCVGASSSKPVSPGPPLRNHQLGRGAGHWPERVSYPIHEQVYWCAWRPNHPKT